MKIRVDFPQQSVDKDRIHLFDFKFTTSETRKQGSRHGTVYSQVHQSQPVVTSTTVALVPLAVLPQGIT